MAEALRRAPVHGRTEHTQPPADKSLCDAKTFAITTAVLAAITLLGLAAMGRMGTGPMASLGPNVNLALIGVGALPFVAFAITGCVVAARDNPRGFAKDMGQVCGIAAADATGRCCIYMLAAALCSRN